MFNDTMFNVYEMDARGHSCLDFRLSAQYIPAVEVIPFAKSAITRNKYFNHSKLNI